MDDPISTDSKSSKVRTALGKGLRMLIPPADFSKGDIRQIQVEQIIPNRYQPRKTFSPETLSSLAASLKDNGLIQPIIVRKEENGRFELIAGERRWRAAQLAGLTEIPALIKNLKEQDLMEWALLENVQREDLNPVEKAQAFSRLINEFSLTQDTIASRLGVDRSTVANLLRILNLPKAILIAISEGRLSVGHAKALLSVAGEENQLIFSEMIQEKGWTVRRSEASARKLTSTLENLDSDSLQRVKRKIQEYQESLCRLLGSKVGIKQKGGKFQITIKFGTLQELIVIADRLSCNRNSLHL